MRKILFKKESFVIILTFLMVCNISQAGELIQNESNDHIICEINTSNSAKWLVMIYLNGDNLLYQVQQLQLDKIKNVGSTESVQIAILHDSNTDGDTKLYYLDGENLIEQDWSIESNMADPDTIVQFVNKVKSDWVFQHDALFISTNRGSGWQGILWDDTNGENRQITMPELYTAFHEITEGGIDKLDVLGIETCMGSMTENAYQIRSFVDYYVAFEDCATAGNFPYCWPYDEPISDLVENPDMSPQDFSITFLDYFEPKKFPMSRITTVLTVTNLLKMEGIKTTLDDLALYFIDHINEYRDDIQNAITETRILGELWYIEFYLDPVHLLNLVKIDDPVFEEKMNAVIDSYEEAVVACDHLEDDPVCGLSLYIPRRKADYDHSFRFDDLLSQYEDTEFAKDSNWDEFLKLFLEIEENTVPNTPIIEGPTIGMPETEYEFIITADDSDNDELYIFIDWDDGTNSGWIGPLSSGEETTVKHIWIEKGSYNIKVKAKDSDESEWGSLTLKMSKNKLISNLLSWKFLFGKISDLEIDPNNRFRFLPVRMLDIGYSSEEGFSMMIRDESYGPFPCCGYIDPVEFYGTYKSTFISGLWIV